jgi:hypothetical protein
MLPDMSLHATLLAPLRSVALPGMIILLVILQVTVLLLRVADRWASCRVSSAASASSLGVRALGWSPNLARRPHC